MIGHLLFILGVIGVIIILYQIRDKSPDLTKYNTYYPERDIHGNLKI